MPNTGINPIDREDAEFVLARMEDADEHGLKVEFMMYYSGGLIQGETARVAALLALDEWDA